MQFIDLKKQYSLNKELILKNINEVLDSGRYIMGPQVKELEEQLAKFIDARYCISLSSGTDALLVALMAIGIKPGDEVITTSFSFFATAETIILLGAKPVFVDIEGKTNNIDPDLIEKKITSKTKAIMPVSLYGQCADFTKINEIASKYNIPVIEDGAQSFGAKHHGKFSCNLTTIGITSFFPSKPLGCYGDGGACFTNDDDLAEKMAMLRVHGQEKRYQHKYIGINGRLDTIQAAILLAKMKEFKGEVKLREELGQYYSDNLKEYVQTPYIESFNTSVYAQYTIEVDHREKFCSYLKDHGIPTAVHYPIPMHKQPALHSFSDSHCPIVEVKAQRVVSLPMHPYLTYEDMDKVIDIVKKAVEKLNG